MKKLHLYIKVTAVKAFVNYMKIETLERCIILHIGTFLTISYNVNF